MFLRLSIRHSTRFGVYNPVPSVFGTINVVNH